MNKIFKVVWSKSKQCYVVVSEMAKNNSGKKKVLASVLAALAVVGAGAVQVDAASYGAGGGNAAGEASVSIGGGYSGANTAANGKWAVAVGDNAHAINEGSIAMGYQATTSGDNSIAIGRNSKSNAAGAIAIGKDNSSNNIRAVAIGEQNTAQDADTIAMGHKNTAKTGGLAIGSGNTADATAGGGRSAGNSQIAIGWDNSAKNEDTIAIGRGTTANARLATAIGRNADALGVGSIAFGSNGEPDANGIAYRTTSKGMGSVAVGMGAGTDGRAALALGGMSKAEADGATAISYGAKSLSKKSVAIGQDSIVNKQKATSNYEFSGSHGTPSPAGYDTETITVNSASAPAGGAVAGNYYDAGSGIAIGNGATVSDESDRAVVVGPDAKTVGNAHYSVVLGSGSRAEASDGFVAGHGSYVGSRESIAMGSGAHVSGDENIRSQAIGFGATVSGTRAYDATAIGATAQVTGVQGGVALGSGSLLSRTTDSNENAGFNSKFVDGTKVRNRAYTADLTGLGNQWDSGSINTGAVSVGNDTQKRQIINVAAGNKDTDAVNVAQLKNVGVRVGADTNTATINGQKVAADFLAYNGQLNIKGDGNRVTTVSENDTNGKDANVNVKFDYSGLVKGKGNITVEEKTDSVGKTVYEVSSTGGSSSSWNLKSTGNTTSDSNKTAKTIEDTNTVNMVAGKNLTVKQTNNTDGADVEFALKNDLDLTKDGSLTIGDTKLVNGGLTITAPAGGTTTNVTLTQSGLDNGGNKIVNVKAGDVSATSTDAVNGSQLHEVKVAERHIKPGTYAVDGNGKVTMKYVDGDNHDVAGEAVITGIAKQDLSNINNAGKNVITGLGTIVKAGDNVNVSESSDATTGQKTYTVNAVTPVVYTKADGTKVVKRPDGTFTTNLDGASGNDVDKADVIASFVDGNGNVTGGNMVINNVGSAIDKTGTSTGDTFLTKLDTAATNTPNAAVNVKDLKTTSDALVDKGLKFTGNNTGTENAHKLGSLVKVQGEGLAATDVSSFQSAAGNIAVVANGTDTLELKLNKNLKGINSVNNGSTAIVLNDAPNATTPAVTIKGGNLSLGDGTTNNKIVNVAPGTNDTDAVNYSQIKGLRTEVKSGSNVTVAKSHGTDGHDIYTISATATGGTASSWNIKSSADTANGGATATGHDANAINVSDQKTVEMVAGKNLTVKQAATTDGAKVEFALSDEIGVGEKGQPGVPGKDGIDGKIGVNGKDGSAVVINGKDGSIGLNGKDGANGLSIKGDKGADGVDGKNGTNGMTRIVYEDKTNTKHEVATLDDGLKFAGDDAQGTDKSKVITKKLNNTVDIIGGANSTNLTDNNIGVNNDNGKLKVQLAKTIDLTKDGSVTTGNTKVDNGGVTITAPTGGTTTNVSLTQSGLDNGGNKIVNVKEGTADTDAVNVKQLKDAKTVLVDGKNTKKEGTGTAADPYKVNVEGDLVDISSITNGSGSGKLSFGPNQTVTVDGDHSITLNAKTGKIGGLQNKTFDPNNFTSGQAATEDQLKSVHDTLKASELHIAPTTGTTEAKGGTASGSTNVYKYDATNKTVTLTYNDGNGQAVNGPKAVIDFSALNVTSGNNYGFSTNAGGNVATGTTASVKPVASGKTVTYAAGKNLTVEQKETNGDLTYTYALDKDLTNLDKIVVNGKDGQPGQDGVTITGPQGTAGVDGNNGKVGISGTDGKDAVSISGKDGVGHIGLTGPAGKDGKDATADITVKDGVPGVDGAPGDSMTRIVYKDKDGKDHEVATHDDGLKFTGNNTSTVNKHHLNSLVKVQGEGVTEAQSTSFQSAAGNINVKANGTDTLEVQLNKDLKGINSIRNSATGPAMTFNTGDIAISGGNLNMGGNKITNVGPGTDGTDAVNLNQLKAARTVVTSTDHSVSITPTENQATHEMTYDLKVNGAHDPRVDQLNEEIGRVGAQGAALAALKPIQYDPLEPTQIMAGYGNYRGNSALAVGVAHYKNESTMLHAGMSWAGGSSHMMANAGVTWKFGNRDAENAIADRYRKGPISAAYALQNEMAAVKAQNAGLKSEVSDLKAENQQMKAQIAAMMAKLGL